MAAIFNTQKAYLLEGFKVAQKVIGRSAKKAESVIQLVEDGDGIQLRASNPGLCYLTWTVPGVGDVPFKHIVAPLDALRAVVERMPAEDISIRTDPKDPNKLTIRCGQRSGKLPVADDVPVFVSASSDAKTVYTGEMKDISTAIKQFDKVSLGGFNAWGCVCATPEGVGYCTDEGNLLALPFPIVKKADHPVMLPTKVLIPATLLQGEVDVKLTDEHFTLENKGWSFTMTLTYVQAPNYKRVVDRFADKQMLPIDLQPITKEVKDFRKACKEGSLHVSVSNGKLKVRAARDAAIRYQSETEIGEAPDVDFTVIPENYLKIGPFFKKDVKVAQLDGSHLFLSSRDCTGIISCHDRTIEFKQGVNREHNDQP